MKGIRRSTLVVVTVVLGLLLAPGARSTMGPSYETQMSSGNPMVQAGVVSNEMNFADGETCSQAQYHQAAAGGNPCKSCPKNLAPGCTRVSCDPCCFQCPGEPFLRCL